MFSAGSPRVRPSQKFQQPTAEVSEALSGHAPPKLEHVSAEAECPSDGLNVSGVSPCRTVRTNPYCHCTTALLRRNHPRNRHRNEQRRKVSSAIWQTHTLGTACPSSPRIEPESRCPARTSRSETRKSAWGQPKGKFTQLKRGALNNPPSLLWGLDDATPQAWLPGSLYLVCWMVALFALVYTPTHWFLRRAFSTATSQA